MTPRLRTLTIATVAAPLAAYLTLGGGFGAGVAVAGDLIGSSDIANGSLRGIDIQNGTLGGGDVRNDSLRSVDIEDNRIRGRDVRDGTLGGGDVRDDSLRSVDIKDNRIRGRDVRDGTLTRADLAAGVLTGPASTTEVVSFQVVSAGVDSNGVTLTSDQTLPANTTVQSLVLTATGDGVCTDNGDGDNVVIFLTAGPNDTALGRIYYDTADTYDSEGVPIPNPGRWRSSGLGVGVFMSEPGHIRTRARCNEEDSTSRVPDFHLDLTMALTPVDPTPTRVLH